MNYIRLWHFFRPNTIVAFEQIMCSCATFHERLCHFHLSRAHIPKPLDETALNQQSNDVQSINVTWHRSINKLWSRFVAPTDEYPLDCCSHICKLHYSDLIFEVKFNQSLSNMKKCEEKSTINASLRAKICWLLNLFFEALKPNAFARTPNWRLIIPSQWIVMEMRMSTE